MFINHKEGIGQPASMEFHTHCKLTLHLTVGWTPPPLTTQGVALIWLDPGLQGREHMSSEPAAQVLPSLVEERKPHFIVHVKLQ